MCEHSYMCKRGRERGREKMLSAAMIVCFWASVCDCVHRFVGAGVRVPS